MFGAHHDGSERHVSTLTPELGETVSVWLRVPHDRHADRVWVRSTPDAEPRFTEAVVDRTTAHETWWRAELELRNPITSYRFLLNGGQAGYRFVNGTGEHHRTVADRDDFRISTFAAAPGWLADTVFYQVFPDRFANSGADREWPSWADRADWDDPVLTDGRVAVRQVYGGDLPGLERRLDHLVALGVGGLYLTPCFPAPSSHRYDADTFDHIDPLLGGDAAMTSLVEACHRRGIKVIGDLTINHSGRGHEWFRAAQADARSHEAGFYFFRHHPDDYEAWFDVPSLPKFDLRDAELRRRLIDGPDSVVAEWLSTPFDLDGWRIDVANMAGRNRGIDVNHDVAVTMRATMAATKPDTYLVGEHCYDASRDLDGDGWHGVMNYLAFTRPVWSFLHSAAAEEVGFFGDPVSVPRFDGTETARALREVYAGQPWRSTVSGFNLLGSHDTARFRTVAGTPEAHRAGAGMLLTFPGVPMIFAGDEVGVAGNGMDGARQPFPWDQSRWDHDTWSTYRDLMAVRAGSSALKRGGLRWVHADENSLVYLRESTDERLLIEVSRTEHDGVTLPAAALDGARAETVYGDSAESIDVAGDTVTFAPAGPGVRIHALA